METSWPAVDVEREWPAVPPQVFTTPGAVRKCPCCAALVLEIDRDDHRCEAAAA